jgi:EAL domain-containing protein (putative c-di-GMP-specific phosphodiesterase class I)
VTFDLDQLTLARVCDILRAGIRGGLQPQCLAVEFRGGPDVDPPQADLDVLAGLKRMGVRFVLDDFGGPGSSLLQLRWLPVDDVKIHGQFFQPAGADRDGAPLAIALLAMARQLGLLTIATGIVHRLQLDLLESQQCDEYQGPLAGPPMAPAEFAKRWLTA